MDHRTGVVLLTVLVLGVAPLASCGDDDSSDSGGGETKTEAPAFDTAQFESDLVDTLSGGSSSSISEAQGPKVTDVACPADIQPAASETIECDASGEKGLAGQVTVTFLDDTGKAYKYKGKLKTSGFTQTVSGSVR